MNKKSIYTKQNDVNDMINQNRRRFVQGLTTGGMLASLGMLSPGLLAAAPVMQEVAILDGPTFDLSIDEVMVNYTGQRRVATAINGSIPAPTLRMREGDDITIRVTNNMSETSSIHWHGLILPSNMDGVPGLSYAGIKPGGGDFRGWFGRFQHEFFAVCAGQRVG